MSSMSDVQNAINIFFRTADMFTQVPTTLSQAYAESIKGFAAPSSVLRGMETTLLKEIDKGNIDMTTIKASAESVNALEKEMNRNGLFAEARYYKGKWNIMTLTSQREQVIPFIENNLDKIEHSFCSIDELNDLSGKSINTFEVNGTEAVDIMKRCNANGIHVNIIETRDDVFKVRYASEDSPVMMRIKYDASADSIGAAKDVIKKQLDWETHEDLDILNQTLNRENKEGYILGRNGGYIKFEKYHAEIHMGDADKPITVRYKSKNFNQSVMNFFREQVDMVRVKSEDELNKFLKCKTSGERQDVFLEYQRENGRPKLTDEEMELMSQHKRESDLINAKLSMHHAEEVVDVNEYNKYESLGAYTEKEMKNFEEQHDNEEKAYSQEFEDYFYDEAEAEAEGFSDEEEKKDKTDEARAEDILSQDTEYSHDEFESEAESQDIGEEEEII